MDGTSAGGKDLDILINPACVQATSAGQRRGEVLVSMNGDTIAKRNGIDQRDERFRISNIVLNGEGLDARGVNEATSIDIGSIVSTDDNRGGRVGGIQDTGQRVAVGEGCWFLQLRLA